MRIAFLVGSLDISGGTYVIFQHASYLAERGHQVTLVVIQPYERRMLEWHPAARSLELRPIEIVGDREFDLAIATWWKTALVLHQIRAGQYAYFVQSVETRFFPEDDTPLRTLVDSTYQLSLPGITEAIWICEYLQRHYGVRYELVPNGIRKDLYAENGSRHASRGTGLGLRFLVEGAFGVPFKNVGRTLKILRRARAGETWLLTPSGVGSIPGVDRVFSRVPIGDTPPIYRSCDVLVKLSTVEGMFGPPLEMFHCGGTAVVYEVTGHEEYLEDHRNALVVPVGDEGGVIAAVHSLQRDRDLLEHLKNGARETARRWPSWEEASGLFEQALDPIMRADRYDRGELEARNQAALQAYERTRKLRPRRPRVRSLQTAVEIAITRLPENVRRPLRHVAYIMETR